MQNAVKGLIVAGKSQRGKSCWEARSCSLLQAGPEASLCKLLSGSRWGVVASVCCCPCSFCSGQQGWAKKKLRKVLKGEGERPAFCLLLCTPG